MGAAKKHSDGEFVICARTDARGVIGMDEALTRAKMYVDAGADMIFPSIDSDKNMNGGLRKLQYCIPQDSKKLQKFKKLRTKQDPEKQKQRQKLRAQEEEFTTLTKKKR